MRELQKIKMIGDKQMREIKFRGKRIDNGEWIVGNLIVNKSKILIQPLDNYVAGIVGHIKVDPKTVGQFTVIQDKNGKDIYEGDIFHLGDKNIKHQVVWNDTGLIGKQIRSSSYVGLDYWKRRIEVIGNINDNPELIK